MRKPCLEIRCLRILPEHGQAEKRHLHMALLMQRPSANCECNAIYSLYITFQTVVVDAGAGAIDRIGDGVLPTSHVNKDATTS